MKSLNSKLLIAVVALQSLILLSQWTGSTVQPVHAQIPDAGGQRQQIVDELKTLNGKMDRMIETLKSGEIQVRTAKPDEKR
jgi:hypothetical protein